MIELSKIWKNSRWIGISVFIWLVLVQAGWIFVFGVDVPIGDQWDGEADWYKNLVVGNFDFGALIAPHNEHRIAITRLFNSLIFKLIGGWRPIVVMYSQALILALLVSFLCLQMARYVTRWHKVSLFFTVLVFSLPYSWQNILSGFQNSFYFMLGFAVLSVYLVSLGESWWAFLAAFILAAVSPFALASGLGTIAVFILLLFFRFLGGRLSALRFGILLLGTFLVVGWHFTLLQHVPGHDTLRAHSAGEFLISFLKLLSWPEAPIGLCVWGFSSAAIIQSVYRAQGIRQWFRRATPIQLFTIGLLGWLLLQYAATAYSRTHSDLMASRYQQTYSLVIPLFFLAMSVFGLRAHFLRTWMVCLVLFIGIAIRSGREWPYLEKGVADTRYAKREIVKAVGTNNFEYRKAREAGGANGHSIEDRILNQITDKKLRPFHLWLEK